MLLFLVNIVMMYSGTVQSAPQLSWDDGGSAMLVESS